MKSSKFWGRGFFWPIVRTPLTPFNSIHWSSPLDLHQLLSRTRVSLSSCSSGTACWTSWGPCLLLWAPCSETNFLQQGSLYWWRRYIAHDADQVSIINRRLKQLYGTLKHPLLPALTYGLGLQDPLDHLNYCNNQPSPAGAHYHNIRHCFEEHWSSPPENQPSERLKSNATQAYLRVKQKNVIELLNVSQNQHFSFTSYTQS